MRPQKINVIVYAPKTDAGKEELANRVASAHADAVIQRIKRLQCPAEKKQQLLDAVIEAARQR